MLKHLQLSVKRKLLPSLCGLTLTLVTLLGTATAGEVNGDFSNNYENSTVDSNNQQLSTTNNYNATGAGSAAPVMSAIAPTVMGGGGNDSCLMPSSTGISLSIIGFSTGNTIQDENCNRRKNARLLGAPQTVGGLGLQVSAISVLCQDPMVFRSMMLANTPCPIPDTTTGRLLMGREAIQKYRENPTVFVVGYNQAPEFWDTLLKEREQTDEEQTQIAVVSGPSISDMFRSSKSTGLQSDRPRED